jgi:tetratricopeptide (TPR) repeat protein
MKIRVGKRPDAATTAGFGPGTAGGPTQPGASAGAGLPEAFPAPVPEPGEERLGRYLLGELLGIGGMGRVHAAYDPELDRQVALKLIWRRDPFLMVRFLQEAQLQARLDHPNICKIYEIEAEGSLPFIAMQRVHGGGLLDAELELELDELLELLIQCGEAVQAAHAAGMIHRDLKPSNILLERDRTGRWQPRLVDFGLAKDLDGTGLTQGSRVMGTPAYMAPEQALGQGVTVRSDLYALGATFYAFLSGRAPFQADSATELLVKQNREQPAPLASLNPELPAALATIVHTCLQRDPTLRYGSAQALVQDLRRLRDGLPIAARPRPHRQRAWALATLAAVLAAGAGFALRPAPPPLAGLQGSPERPLRILWMTVHADPRIDPLLFYEVSKLISTTLAACPQVKVFQAPGGAQAPQTAAGLRAQARATGADLVLTASLREQGGGHRLTLAGLGPGQFLPRRLLERSFDRSSYLAMERELHAALPGLLGLAPPPPAPFLQHSLEVRQGMLQVHALAAEQHNSESDRTAMALLRQILAEAPDWAEAHRILASILNAMSSEAAHHGRLAEIGQRLAEAEAESRAAIRLEPRFPGSYYTLSATLRLRGDLDGAEQAAKAGMRYDPDGPGGALLLATAAGQRPGPEAFRTALDYLQLAIRRMPSEVESHYRLAQLHLDAGQFGPAMTAIDRALALVPNMEYAHLVRSNILLWSGRTAEAERMLREALAKVPNSRLLKRNLAYTAYLLHDPATFGPRLEIVRGIWPAGSPTQVFLAGLGDAFAGRWDQVAAAYGRSLATTRARLAGMPFTERSSASVDYYLMGRVLAGGPDRQRARAFIQFAERLHPKRLRLAQRDPGFQGLWPEPEPWPGD